MKMVLNLNNVANSVMCDEQSISSHSDDSAIGWGVTDWYQSHNYRELGRIAMFDLVYSRYHTFYHSCYLLKMLFLPICFFLFYCLNTYNMLFLRHFIQYTLKT
ncbi:hypothetical protein Hanom_Chr13g01188211 [Helianthus anomalus]